MAVIIKDLGVVTAYAYAVAGGYVGTEAEFTELLGNIAEDLETIENLTVSATTLPAGSPATASYSNGHLTLGIPQGIKGDKGDKGDKGNTGATGNGIASITLTSTSGAVKTYTITFTNGTTTTFDVTDGEVTTESLLETLEEYAKIDGLYEDMTVGNAEQLIASDYVTDKAPYLYRKTGGSTDVGNREYDTLVGASAVWNQLIDAVERTVNSVVITVANGKLTFTGTATASGGRTYWLSSEDIPIVNGHKYLAIVTGDTNSEYLRFYVTNKSNSSEYLPYFSASTILNASFNATCNVGVNLVVDVVYNNTVLLQFVDLTQFFGSSTIPDYVYTLEQSTAGSGVAWLRQYFPTLFEYHEYDSGTLKSVEGLQSHDMVGFNQWDEEYQIGYWNVLTGNHAAQSGELCSKNYIPVIPNTVYFYHKGGGSQLGDVIFYDENKTFISGNSNGNRPFTTPSNCHYIQINFGNNYGTTYNHDICINLSNSGYRNGEYESYWKRSYPLDSTWIGRGIYKLGADGKPYAVGDTYAHDGTVTVNYTERAHQSGDESLADAITDGTNTVVKLSTPTTTTLTPFQSPQICDDFGTEEYVTDCLIPVGHETKYPANLRDKVQHLPDLSNLGNGNYVINQNGMNMSLIPTTSIIPALPTTDGTYNLKCTVSGGQPTLTWEVDS